MNHKLRDYLPHPEACVSWLAVRVGLLEPNQRSRTSDRLLEEGELVLGTQLQRPDVDFLHRTYVCRQNLELQVQRKLHFGLVVDLNWLYISIHGFFGIDIRTIAKYLVVQTCTWDLIIHSQ